ncbi:MAG: PrsW family glutamic-type intramembrane protease [Saprospiraceae bacterium]
MIFVIIAVSVFLYCALILFFIYRSTGRPRGQLFICFGFGIFSAVIAFGLEALWNHLAGDFISSHRAFVFIESFFGVGLIEEFAKWIWLVLVIRSWSQFLRYTDGIVFAVAMAAGFSLAEGVAYAIFDVGIGDIIIRGLTAVPVHFLFAIIMGFLFARYKLESSQFFWFSLLIPAFLHGLYDFFILQEFTDLLMGAAILVLLGSLALSIWVCRVAIRADRLRIT